MVLCTGQYEVLVVAVAANHVLSDMSVLVVIELTQSVSSPDEDVARVERVYETPAEAAVIRRQPLLEFVPIR